MIVFIKIVVYSSFLFVSLFVRIALSKVQEEFSEQLTTHTYKATAVFDIDEVTCRRATQEEMEQHKPARYFPKSTVIDWTDRQTGLIYYHHFDPFMPYVFGNLLENNVRIVFFSSGKQVRNEPLIETYFKQMLGEDTYHVLKQRGQFSVFSRGNMVHGLNGNYVKDLEAINLSVEDSVLIDDQIPFRAFGQETMIKLTRYVFNDFFQEIAQILQKERKPSYEWVFALHHGPYILGVIHTALEKMADSPISFRLACDEIFQPYVNHPSPSSFYPNAFPTLFWPKDYMNSSHKNFIERMIGRGLSEINRRAPGVTPIKSFPYSIEGNPWAPIINAVQPSSACS